MDTNWTTVDAIVYFGSDGVIKPLKVRFKENNEYVVVKIDNIRSVETVYIAGYTSYIYECQAFVFHTIKSFKIRFISDKNLWEMRNI